MEWVKTYGDFSFKWLFWENDEPILKEIKTEENSHIDGEVVNKIIEVLDTKIRPAVARDEEILNLRLLKME